MDEYIGLDVSMKETAISVRRAGKRVWRGKCASDPQLLAAVIRKHAPSAKRVVFETGPLAVWFYHALTAQGLPAICIDARHTKAALDMAANKTTMLTGSHIWPRSASSAKCGSRRSTACYRGPWSQPASSSFGHRWM